MRIVFSRHFVRSAKDLPEDLHDKLDMLIDLLAKNPYSTRLHTKPLHGQFSGSYSFRITRDWRVIFQ